MSSDSSATLLLASPDSEYVNGIQVVLRSNGFHYEIAMNGKEAQGFLNENNFEMILLDLELSNFSSFEILKYIKLKKQSVKVLLYVKDKVLLEELNLDVEKLKRLGVLDTVYSTLSPQKLLDKILLLSRTNSWRNIEKNSPRRLQRLWKNKALASSDYPDLASGPESD